VLRIAYDNDVIFSPSMCDEQCKGHKIRRWRVNDIFMEKGNENYYRESRIKEEFLWVLELDIHSRVDNRNESKN